MTEMTVKDGGVAPTSPWNAVSGRDWLLARIIHLANRDGLECGITLTLGGSTISGTLISGGVFASEMHELLEKNMTTGPSGDAVKKKLLDVFSDAFTVNDQIRMVPNDFDAEPPAYIHLRNANWLLPNGQTLFDVGRHWRARLSNVDSFSLGM